MFAGGCADLKSPVGGQRGAETLDLSVDERVTPTLEALPLGVGVIFYMGQWAKIAKPIPVALAGLLLSLVAFLIPPSFTRSLITWNPDSASASGSLQLTRGWPDRMTLRGDCEKMRSAPPGVLFDSGSLRLKKTANMLQAVDPTETVLAEAPITDEPCDVVMEYSDTSEVITLSVGSIESAHTLKSGTHLAVERLQAPLGAESGIESVAILTRPSAITQTADRIVCLVISVLLLLGAFVMELRRRSRSRVHWPVSMRLVGSDGFVAFALAISVVLIPALLDDGWVFERGRWFFDRGVFANYFGGDYLMPQGFWNESLLAIFIRAGVPFVGLRIVVALALIVGWIILRAGLLDRLDRGGASVALVRLPCAAVYLAFAIPYLVTLRAEPWVALCAVVAFVGLARFLERPSSIALAVVLVASAFAVAAHQTGWVLLGPALVALWLSVTAVRRRTIKRRDLSFALIVGVGSGIFLFALQFDVGTLRAAVEEVAATPSASFFILDELNRYSLLLGSGVAPRLFAVLLLIPITTFALTRSGYFSQRERWLVGAAFLSFAGLLLTSSKWIWHFGVYAIPAVVLCAVLLTDLVRPNSVKRRQVFFAVLLPVLVLLMGFSFKQIYGWWGSSAYSFSSWLEFSETLAGNSTRIWWVVAFVVSWIGGIVIDRHRSFFSLRLGTIIFAVFVLLPISFSVAWIVGDSIPRDQWSQAKMNLKTLAGRDSCGALSGVSVVIGVDPLVEIERSSESLAPGGFPHISGITDGPFDGLPTWGTWGAGAVVKTPDDLSNTLRSPIYSVGGVKELTFWSAGSADIRVVFFTSTGKQLNPIKLLASGQQRWDMHTLAVPADALRVTILLDDNSILLGGWGAVSAPVRAVRRKAADVIPTSITLVGPFERMFFPCANLPSPVDGYWPRVDYLLPSGVLVESPVIPVDQITRTVVACSAVEGQCFEHVQYSMAKVKVVRVQ